MRGVTSNLPLPAKGVQPFWGSSGGRSLGCTGRGVGPSGLLITSYGITHPNPSLGREGLW